MHVLLVTGEFPPMQGGVGDYTAHLARALRARGAEVTVLTSQRAIAEPHSSAESSWVLPEIADWGTRCWRHILHVARERHTDVVHVQYQTAAFGMHPAINILPLTARLTRPRPRFVVTFHDLKPPYLFPKAGPLRKLPAWLLARSADAVIATNDEDLAVLRLALQGEKNGSVDSRLHLIPIGSNIPPLPAPSATDVEEWREGLGIEPQSVLLSFFGFLNRNKGTDVLLDALALLSGKHRNLYLLVVGGTIGDSDPSNRAYAHLIRGKADDPRLRGRVFWTGFTRPEEVSLNLQRTDICVLPFREGSSYRHGTLVAALAHGLPIITTIGVSARASAGIGPPPLSHGQNCLLVPPGDAGKLAEAIEILGWDGDLRARLSQGSRTLAPHFEWGRIAELHLELYRDLLAD